MKASFIFLSLTCAIEIRFILSTIFAGKISALKRNLRTKLRKTTIMDKLKLNKILNYLLEERYEATKLIKKIRPELPVIAQTANAIAGDHEKSLAAGCDDYIAKLINIRSL